MGYLRLLYRIPWLFLHVLVGTPVTVLCHYRPLRNIPLGGRPLFKVVSMWWARMVCRIFGLRLHVHGIMWPGPQLVAANHISWIDITVMHSVGPMGFVSKAEIERWPLIGHLARVGGTVFHHRGSHDSSSGVAAEMAERLRAGENVAIYPEGGIRPGAGIKRFHGRMFAAAIDTAAPVQPMMLRYLRDGRHDHDMTFLPGEHFTANVLRLLRQGPCVAEVVVLPRIESAGRQRRELAAEAEAAVRSAFDAELPDD
jgi:1-acyl-sn-glycerol-3-phosphate acyltransferase